MSDRFEKLSGVRFLPIFPLSVVLFPGEPLPLHIFEPRYRQMLADIDTSDRLFGIIHFDPEASETNRPEPGSIGCVAEVVGIDPLPDGRSNIFTRGLSRFVLIDYIVSDTDYLIADVEFFGDDEAVDTARLESLAITVRSLFDRVANAANDLSGGRGSLPAIAETDPEKLSFVVAVAFGLDAETKLGMQRSRTTSERLERVHEILVGAVAKMEESAQIQKAARTNGHSKKKIDY